jgi:hypothetical protein
MDFPVQTQAMLGTLIPFSCLRRGRGSMEEARKENTESGNIHYPPKNFNQFLNSALILLVLFIVCLSF